MVARKYLWNGSLLLIIVLLLYCFYRLTQLPFLTFSDAAKFGDIGRNLASGLGYGESFVRFDANLATNNNGLFSAVLIPPLIPYLDALAFKLFGVSDFAVIGVSAFFYFVLVVATYLLGRKIWGNLAGLISAVAVAASISFLSYATSGASETLFSALIIFSIYLFSLRKKWSEILGLLFLFLLYLTRAQGPFYIVPIFLYFVYLKTKNVRKTLKVALLIFVISSGIILASFLFSGIPTLVVLKQRIIVSLIHNSTLAPGNDVLRINTGTLPALIFSNLVVIFKKLFYNLYNFYKLLPNIFSPYLIVLFLISLFRWGKDKFENAFKITVLTTIVIIALVNALTIPLYRYLHPLMPLIYLLAIAELVNIIKGFIVEKKKATVISGILVFLFIVGQSLGYIFLDSRFTKKTVNIDQPPVYVQLSKILKDNSKPSDIVVTNLDTWGSWYGERRTIWYPLTPGQLNELDPQKVTVDAIYLTSYLIDDENYYMGEQWRSVLNNPNDAKKWDKFISQEYKLKGVYEVKASEDYEKHGAKAVLLVRK